MSASFPPKNTEERIDNHIDYEWKMEGSPEDMLRNMKECDACQSDQDRLLEYSKEKEDSWML